MILYIIFGAVFGLIVGSFLNVVILRMRTGRGFGGRSECLSCGHTLSWHELIPLFSYLHLRGRCRTCKSEISIQYPVVEAVTAFLYGATVWRLSSLLLAGQVNLFAVNILFWWVLIAVFVVLATYDARHRCFPGQLLGVFALIALIASAFGGFWFGTFILVGFTGFPLWALLSAILVALPFLLAHLVSNGTWIGFGDVEVIAISALMLGIIPMFSVVALAAWTACAWILAYMGMMALRHRGKRGAKPSVPRIIPFGPFLLSGLLLVALFGIDIIRFLLSV